MIRLNIVECRFIYDSIQFNSFQWYNKLIPCSASIKILYGHTFFLIGKISCVMDEAASGSNMIIQKIIISVTLYQNDPASDTSS